MDYFRLDVNASSAFCSVRSPGDRPPFMQPRTQAPFMPLISMTPSPNLRMRLAGGEVSATFSYGKTS